MQVSVTFKNIKPSDDLKQYVGSKLNRFDKFLDNPAEANVVLSTEKFRHIAEITITGDRLNIVGREETDDSYAAIDMVLDKLEKQLKKSKTKEKQNKRRSAAKGKNKSKTMISPTEIEVNQTIIDPDDEPTIEVMNIEYKPMSIEEASMQMKLVDNTFIVFTNANTERVNVLYRKNDGNYGLIQPNR